MPSTLSRRQLGAVRPATSASRRGLTSLYREEAAVAVCGLPFALDGKELGVRASRHPAARTGRARLVRFRRPWASRSRRVPVGGQV